MPTEQEFCEICGRKTDELNHEDGIDGEDLWVCDDCKDECRASAGAVR